MKRLALGTLPTSEDLHRYFFNSPWLFIREDRPQNNDPHPHEIEWVAGDHNEDSITFVNDHMLGVQFFAYQVAELRTLPQVEARLFNSPFDILTHEEVWRRFREARNDDDLLKNFKRLMVISLEASSPDLLTAVEKMLVHPQGEVRSESVAAISYLLWPEVPSLMKPLLNDPVEIVRTRAQIVIDGYAHVMGQLNKPQEDTH